MQIKQQKNVSGLNQGSVVSSWKRRSTTNRISRSIATTDVDAILSEPRSDCTCDVLGLLTVRMVPGGILHTACQHFDNSIFRAVTIMGNLQLIPSQDDLYPQQSGKEPGQNQQWNIRINNPIPRVISLRSESSKSDYSPESDCKRVLDLQQMGIWLVRDTMIERRCQNLEFLNLPWKHLDMSGSR